MAPIPTVYDGIEYRSRLEARWAAFMSNIGWQFTYEPFDGDGYIPDFVVHGNRPLFVEVKPAVSRAEFQNPQRKIERGLAEHRHDVLIVGADPLPQLGQTPWGGLGSDDWHPTAGLLAERWDDAGNPGWGDDWGWDTGHWMTCTNCGTAAVFHATQTYMGRPCGCYAGDHYMGGFPSHVIRSMWADACNSVKWRGRAA